MIIQDTTKWMLLLVVLTFAHSQNSRSYDTNDWIPIEAQEAKKAQGRVLNLDAPNQRFFPDEEYLRKRQQNPQFSSESSYHNKGQHQQRLIKENQEPYSFENVPTIQPSSGIKTQFVPPPPPPSPGFSQQQQQIRYVPQSQLVQQQVLNEQLTAPPQHSPNLYRTAAPPPRSQSQNLYQGLNPGAINREILGAIQNQVKLPPPSLPSSSQRVKSEDKETVQLLYVPLENLKPNQPVSQQSETVYQQAEIPLVLRQEQQANRNQQLQPQRQQQQIANIQQDFISQALAAHKLQQQFQSGERIYLQSTTSTTTTPKPKKRKTHQPPLAVYMEKKGPANVKDVISVLKNAKTISVQDNVGPDSPQIFVGPSNLNPPEGYTKFPLPYLSTVEGNRIERKVDQLPFFVAPLSYKAPEGYSKIPLPSPHVGSVVVSTTPSERDGLRNQQFNRNQQYDFDELTLNSFLTPSTTTSLPPDQNSLLGFNKDFDFDGDPKLIGQNYQQGNVNYQGTPTKDYVPFQQNSYQLGQNFQNGNRGIFRQQILPQRPIVESGFLPNNFDLKSQLPQFQNPIAQDPSYATSKLQPQDAYSFTESLEKLSSTTPPSVRVVTENRFSAEPVDKTQYQQQQPELVALPQRNQQQSEIAVSQSGFETLANALQQSNRTLQNADSYELHQINNQEKRPKTQEQLVQQTDYAHYEIPTTPRSRQRQRQRQRSRITTTTTTTTPRTFQTEKYTVLEEFSIGPKETDSSTTTKYTTEVETIPANVFKLNSDELKPIYIQRPQEQEVKQHILNQDMLDQQILRSFNIQQQQIAPARVPHVKQSDENSHLSPLVYNRGSPAPVRYVPERGHQPTPAPERYVPERGQEPSPAPERYVPERGQEPSPAPERYVPERGQEPSSAPVRYVPEREQEPSQAPERYAPEQGHDHEELPQLNPYLPGLINDLQDQSVRQLLVPNLLVPTTTERVPLSTLPAHQPEDTLEEVTVKPRPPPTTTEAIRIETTTMRRSRGRQRANSSRYSTTTSYPRRTIARRRPSHTRASTTTTERPVRTTTESYYETTRRNVNSRQRFRTRGRPQPQQREKEADYSANERSSLIASVDGSSSNRFKQPSLESRFQVSSEEPQSQSYLQLEQTINSEEVKSQIDHGSSAEQIKDYHQVYSLPPQLSATERNYENTRVEGSTTPIVDVLIHHPVATERTDGEVLAGSKIVEDPNLGRLNIQSGGVLYNHKSEDVTTPRTRVRVRGRLHSRTRTGSSTTSRPIRITSATSTRKPDKVEDDDNEEFYGFIRSPNFNRPAALVYTTTESPQPIRIYSSTPRTVLQSDDDDDDDEVQPQTASQTVHFVGEIRPKYPSSDTDEASEAPAKPTKTRNRIRVPSRKVPQPTANTNEISVPKSDEQTDQRTNNDNIALRSRSRGKNHFRVPETLVVKTSRDEDVEGGNYPEQYLKTHESSTQKSNFQITIDPFGGEEEDDDDQVPHSSLYRPKWIEASALPPTNDITFDEKKIFAVDDTPTVTAVPVDEAEVTGSAEDQDEEESKAESDIRTTVTPENDGMTTETEVSETATVPVTESEEIVTSSEVADAETTTLKRRKGGKRRGVWKLVRHKPIDQFEMAESQNYRSVLNNFDRIVKAKPIIDDGTTTTTTTTTEASFIDNFYKFWGISGNDENNQANDSNGTTTTQKVEATTIPITPTFPDEITEITTISEDHDTIKSDTDDDDTAATTTESITMKKYDVEPWKMHVIKTSTSTEISHETETCYKGRCIKTKDDEDVKRLS